MTEPVVRAARLAAAHSVLGVAKYRVTIDGHGQLFRDDKTIPRTQRNRVGVLTTVLLWSVGYEEAEPDALNALDSSHFHHSDFQWVRALMLKTSFGDVYANFLRIQESQMKSAGVPNEH